jgi:tetratricopeptide (TPR) repeat protein
LADNSIIAGRLFYPLFLICYFAVLILIIAKNNSKVTKATCILSAVKDPDEKIRKIEELNTKGFFKKSLGQYFNHLSVAYYERGDNEKALELIREAYGSDNSAKPLLFGKGLTASDVYRMNEISYLIALGQIDDAERLVHSIDESRLKQPNALNHVLTSRAQIAVRKGDAAASRELLRKAQSLPIKVPKDVTDNIRWILLLVEAECDLLEGDKEAALSKLNNIEDHCAYAPTVRRTEVIMN